MIWGGCWLDVAPGVSEWLLRRFYGWGVYLYGYLCRSGKMGLNLAPGGLVWVVVKIGSIS